MFTGNPFLPLAALLSPAGLQAYLVLMVLAVIVGTAFDLTNEKKARFFLQDRARARAAATQRLGAADWYDIVLRTLLIDIATFGEFCNWRRRVSHALMFYGFVLYLLTSVALVFAYPADPLPPPVWPLLWHLGVVLVLAGGYWFFLFLRVNVTHDGQPPWRLVRADLFIVTLLLSLTFALLMGVLDAAQHPTAARVCAGLYVVFNTLLCVTVPWSKFAHMFYKPVVAWQKRVEEADGSSDLPPHTTTGAGRCPRSPT